MIGLVIQARTGSTRLPNKMTMSFYEGRSVLELLLIKLKTRFTQEQIVVATTTSTGDDAIDLIGKQAGVNVYRGSEQDVLERFVGAAEKFGYEKIVRICADNPFLDIDALWRLVESFDESSADYLSYSLSDGTPTIKTHYGLWAEGVTLSALKKVQHMTQESIYHEHVTNYIYTHRDAFVCEFMKIPEELERNRKIRLTLDTKDDFVLQQEIYSSLVRPGVFPQWKEVIVYLDEHPECYQIMNAQILENSK